MTLSLGDPLPDLELIDHTGRRGAPPTTADARWCWCSTVTSLDCPARNTCSPCAITSTASMTPRSSSSPSPRQNVWRLTVSTSRSRSRSSPTPTDGCTTFSVPSAAPTARCGRSARSHVRPLLRSGRRLARPTEDINQLGADAVIGRDGRLRYLSLPSTPDARPPVSDLIAASTETDRPPSSQRRRNGVR